MSRGLVSSAQKVIQRLISQCSSAPEATSAAEFAIARGMDLGFGGYVCLIRKLVISGDALTAESLYMDCIVGQGLEPDRNLLNSMIICYSKLVTYQIMLSKYCKDRKVDRALELLDYMLRCNIPPNVHCYTVVLAALCTERKFKELYSLYHKMLDNGVVPDHVFFFIFAKNHPIGDPLYFAQTILQAIAKESCSFDVFFTRPKSTRGAILEIERLLEEIVKGNSVSADKAFSIYIIALCIAGKLDSALHCLEKMKNLCMLPLPTALNSLVKLLAQEGNVDAAESLIEVLQEQGLVPKQSTFAIIVNEHCIKGDVASAIDVLDKIEEMGIGANISVYNSIIGCLGRQKMMREAEKFYYRMREHGIDPDETLFVTMINAYSNNGWVNEAREFFKKMTEHNLRPNSRAYTALITGLVKKNMTEKSCLYLNKMMKDGFMPNAVLYTSLVKQFLRKREFEFAFRLVDLMKKSQLEQDLVTYITIVSGVSRNIRRFDRKRYLSRTNLDKGKNLLFHLLHEKAILLNRKSLQVLVTCEEEMKSAVLQVIEQIKKVPYMPDLHLHNGIIFGICFAQSMHAAYEHLNLMRKEGVEPNRVTYTILIDGHIQIGELHLAVGLFNEMNANGFPPDRMLFNTLIRGFCKVGKVFDALTLSHMMQKRGFLPSKGSYEKILGSLCANDSGFYALKIYEEMISHDYTPCRYHHGPRVQLPRPTQKGSERPENGYQIWRSHDPGIVDRYPGVLVRVGSSLGGDDVLLLVHWAACVDHAVLQNGGGVAKDEVDGAVDVAFFVELALRVDVECVLVPFEAAAVEHGE
ncbi:hypothetical protein MIMGU_mgv1a022106mg, partial [Erythranthe guttata]